MKLINKKIILHLIPTLKGGGAEYQLTNIFTSNNARQDTYDIHIAVRRADKRTIDYLANKGIKIYILGDHKTNLNPFLFFKILFLIQKLKPSIIQTWLPQMDIIGGLAALILRIPYIFSERSSSLAYVDKSITMCARKILSKKCSAIVANSNAGKSYWKSQGFEGNLFKINNGIDFEGIKNAQPIKLPILKKDKDTFDFLVVGRLAKEKQVLKVVEAFSAIKNIEYARLIIIGDGPEKAAINMLINNLNLSSSIILLGWIDNWWGILQQSKCLISCSSFEGQPNVLLEAIAAKCPTIVSDTYSHREILDNSSTSFVDTCNTETISNQIQNVMTDYEKYQQMAQLAYNIVKKNSFSHIAQEYIGVYDYILGKK